MGWGGGGGSKWAPVGVQWNGSWAGGSNWAHVRVKWHGSWAGGQIGPQLVSNGMFHGLGGGPIGGTHI